MIVLDASSVLAAVLNEEGAEQIYPASGVGVISAVNMCEVLTRLHDKGWDAAGAIEVFRRFNFEITPFDAKQAEAAASMRPGTRGLGLSLGDRACLALAVAKGLPVLTADRIWASLDLGIEIRLVR